VWFNLCTPFLHFSQNESMRLIILLLLPCCFVDLLVACTSAYCWCWSHGDSALKLGCRANWDVPAVRVLYLLEYLSSGYLSSDSLQIKKTERLFLLVFLIQCTRVTTTTSINARKATTVRACSVLLD
jgi:hypothetical protein